MSKGERKTSNLSHAAHVLQSLLQNSKSPLSQQYKRWRLWNEWESVVGPEAAKSCMPVGYHNGTLYIWVNSAARMQEMTFMVRAFREKINNFMGHYWANSIRFTLDRKAVPQSPESAEDIREYLSKPPQNEDGEPQL